MHTSVYICIYLTYSMMITHRHTRTITKVRLLSRLRNSAGGDIDVETEVYVESDDIIRLLRKQKIQLDRGTVERLRNENKQFINVEGKPYDFDTKKRCSAAIQRDFDEIRAPTDNMPIDFNNLSIRRNLGWSFYSLKDDLHYNLDEYLIDSRARADLEYPNLESETSHTCTHARARTHTHTHTHIHTRSMYACMYILGLSDSRILIDHNYKR